MTTTFKVEFDWANNGTWVDETQYVRSVKTWQGFEKPGDLVAAIGRCDIVLDNGTKRFSPAYALGALYGNLLPRRPVRVSGTSGATTWVMWSGFIELLHVEAGTLGERVVKVECVDGVVFLGRALSGAVYLDVIDVEWLVAEIWDSAGFDDEDLDIGNDNNYLYHVGRTWHPNQTTWRQALMEVCWSVWGRSYVARDGAPTYIGRADRQSGVGAAALVLANEAVKHGAIDLPVDDIVNFVKVTVYPVEIVGTARDLWTARTVLRLVPGQARVVYGPYRDELGELCAGSDVVDPVAHTDYEVNDRSDGTGFDYTEDAAFSIVTVDGGSRMQFTLTNSATGPLFVTLLKVRGKPVVARDPVTFERSNGASVGKYSLRVSSFDLLMQSDLEFGETYADFLLARLKEPGVFASSVVVEEDIYAGVNVFSLELLDRVSVSDDQSGLSGVEHLIRAVGYEISSVGCRTTLGLERAELSHWLLGKEDYGELGLTTRLGL